MSLRHPHWFFRRTALWAIMAVIALVGAQLTLMPTVALAVPSTSTTYLPVNSGSVDLNSSVENSLATFANYPRSGVLFYKLDVRTMEAMVVGYDRQALNESGTGPLTAIEVPSVVSFTASDLSARFGGSTAYSNFAGDYLVVQVGPQAFATKSQSTGSVTSPVSLTSVVLPASIVSLGVAAFAGQCKITAVVIPDGVTDIGLAAFERMDPFSSNNTECASAPGLQNITFGYGLNRFYGNVFNMDSRLTRVTFKGASVNLNQPDSSAGSYPTAYNTFEFGWNGLMAHGVQNECRYNFTYVFNMRLEALADSASGWEAWARANSCFTGTLTTASVTFAPSTSSAPVASNPTFSSIDVAFDSPAFTGGAAIIDYTVSARKVDRTGNPADVSATVTRSGSGPYSTTMLGLSPSTAYTFTVQSRNSEGLSLASVASNQVTTLTPVNHTVTFETNQGSGTMAAQSGYSNTQLTATTFIRSGYVFDGWNTEALVSNSSPGTAYSDEADYSFAADLTLYAQWLQIHSVVFDANMGTGTMVNQTGVGSTALAANAFDRTGFSFAGWNTEATVTSLNQGTSYANLASYAFGSSITLYAQWTLISVPIVSSTPPVPSPSSGDPTWLLDLNFDGGVAETSLPQYRFSPGQAPIQLPVPTKPDNVFKGWFAIDDSNNAVPLSYLPAASQTLTARWALIERAATIKTTSSRVYFFGDSAVLTSKTKNTLRLIARKMRGAKNLKINIDGYVLRTAVTSADYQLSLARASAVLNYLKNLGVKATFAAQAKGIAPESTSSARRAEISVRSLG